MRFTLRRNTATTMQDLLNATMSMNMQGLRERSSRCTGGPGRTCKFTRTQVSIGTLLVVQFAGQNLLKLPGASPASRDRRGAKLKSEGKGFCRIFLAEITGDLKKKKKKKVFTEIRRLFLTKIANFPTKSR